jgi:hypothetical protein
VAVIPAPVVPVPPAKQFGEPSWVKVVKTTSHNANNIILQDLISDDLDGDGKAEWQNHEPSEVETEWYLLQANTAGGGAKDEVQGLADDMGDGSETVTRRYEFYKYGAAADTRDGEKRRGDVLRGQSDHRPEQPGLPAWTRQQRGGHRRETATRTTSTAPRRWWSATTPARRWRLRRRHAARHGREPAGCESGVAYMPRTVVIGGNSPYAIELTAGSLPLGLSVGDYVDPDSGDTSQGVLSGTPTTPAGSRSPCKPPTRTTSRWHATTT